MADLSTGSTDASGTTSDGVEEVGGGSGGGGGNDGGIAGGGPLGGTRVSKEGWSDILALHSVVKAAREDNVLVDCLRRHELSAQYRVPWTSEELREGRPAPSSTTAAGGTAEQLEAVMRRGSGMCAYHQRRKELCPADCERRTVGWDGKATAEQRKRRRKDQARADVQQEPVKRRPAVGGACAHHRRVKQRCPDTCVRRVVGRDGAPKRLRNSCAYHCQRKIPCPLDCPDRMALYKQRAINNPAIAAVLTVGGGGGADNSGGGGGDFGSESDPSAASDPEGDEAESGTAQTAMSSTAGQGRKAVLADALTAHRRRVATNPSAAKYTPRRADGEAAVDTALANIPFPCHNALHDFVRQKFAERAAGGDAPPRQALVNEVAIAARLFMTSLLDSVIANKPDRWKGQNAAALYGKYDWTHVQQCVAGLELDDGAKAEYAALLSRYFDDAPPLDNVQMPPQQQQLQSQQPQL